VDDAIDSAAKLESKTRPSISVDHKFERAVKALSIYEVNYHRSNPSSEAGHLKNVHRRMLSAKVKDKSCSRVLHRLKEKLFRNVRLLYMILLINNTGL